MIAPRSIDAQSVVDALYATVKSIGDVADVTLWNADSATEGLALVARATGGKIAPPAVGISPLRAAHEQGLAILETLTFGPETEGPSTVWRYAVPVNFGEMAGVAAVDFAQEPPDMPVLNHVTSAFRIPLAAALALTTAREESESARLLLESARDLSHMRDVDDIVSSALERAMRITDAATGSIMLYQEDGATLSIAAAAGLPEEVVRGTAVRPGDGIAGWVALSGQPLVIEDMPGRSTPARARGVRSAVSVPIADEQGTLGVLNVGARAYPTRFTGSHLASLETLARQVATAIRTARAVESAGELYFDTLRALALAMETKDPYAAGGTDRVMRYAVELGRQMGLSGDQARALEIAAMLHDIGMPTSGEPTLYTDKPLTTVERALLTLHPVIAADILEQAPALHAVTPIVYHHHEHYDGSGYVNGLAGDDIPVGARVLAIADSFVAMTSERPFRRAMTISEALSELQLGAGSQFDPAMVEAFCAMVESEAGTVRDPYGTRDENGA
ncbi:MAG: GAF domain-containing protein [Clostridiales bacterium]|nr:GAF domain-containing protein [Clostridiales bacterium]